MTVWECHSERSRGISWKRTVRLFYHSTVILNAVKNPAKRFCFFPAACVSVVQAFCREGGVLLLNKQRFREMFRQAQHDSVGVSFRAKSRNLVETNAEACSLLFRCPRRAGCKRKKNFYVREKAPLLSDARKILFQPLIKPFLPYRF